MFEGALAILHGFRMAGFSGGAPGIVYGSRIRRYFLRALLISHAIEPAGGAVYSPETLVCWPDGSPEAFVSSDFQSCLALSENPVPPVCDFSPCPFMSFGCLRQGLIM